MPDPLSIHEIADAWARQCLERMTGSRAITPQSAELFREVYDHFARRLSFQTWATPASAASNPEGLARHAERVVRQMCDQLAPNFGFSNSSGLVDRVVFDPSERFQKGTYASFEATQPSAAMSLHETPVRTLRFGSYFLYGGRDAGSEGAGQLLTLLHELEHAARYAHLYNQAISGGMKPVTASEHARLQMGLWQEDRSLYSAEEVRAESGAFRRLEQLLSVVPSELTTSSREYIQTEAEKLNHLQYQSTLARSTRDVAGSKQVESRLTERFAHEQASGNTFGGLLIGASLSIPSETPTDFRIMPFVPGDPLCLNIDIQVAGRTQSVRSPDFPGSVLRAAFRVVWPGQTGMPSWLDGSESGLVSGSPAGWAVHPALWDGLPAMAAQMLEEFPLAWNAGGASFPLQQRPGAISSFGDRGRWDAGRILFVEAPQSITLSGAVVRAEPSTFNSSRFFGRIQTLKTIDAAAMMGRILDGADRVTERVEAAVFGRDLSTESNSWRDLDASESQALRSGIAARIWEQFLEALALCRWLRSSGLNPSPAIVEQLSKVPDAPHSWSHPGPYYASQARPTGIGTAIREALRADSGGSRLFAALVVKSSSHGIRFARLVCRQTDGEAAKSTRLALRSRLARLAFTCEDGNLRWVLADPEFMSDRELDAATRPSNQRLVTLKLNIKELRLWADYALPRLLAREFRWLRARPRLRHHKAIHEAGSTFRTTLFVPGQPPNGELLEVMRADSFKDAGARATWEATLDRLDRPEQWARSCPSVGRLRLVPLPDNQSECPNLICLGSPPHAGSVAKDAGGAWHSDQSWTASECLSPTMRNRLQTWIGPAVWKHLDCPAGIHAVVSMRTSVPVPTFNVADRPDSFDANDIRRAMKLGGECTAQAATAAALGLSRGFEARTCSGALLIEPPAGGYGTMSLHMWAELRHDGVVTVCDDFGAVVPRFYSRTQRLNYLPVLLVPIRKSGEYTGLVSTKRPAMDFVADQRFGPSETLALLKKATPPGPQSDDAFTNDLLELVAGCGCVSCLWRRDAGALLSRVVHGLSLRGMHPPDIDAALSHTLIPGPFALLVADRLAEAIQQGRATPVTRLFSEAHRTIAADVATAFRARREAAIAALRRDAELYSMPVAMRRLLDDFTAQEDSADTTKGSTP